MIQTGFESRIKVQDLIDSQLPSFILDESPNAVEFLKQYYISQEYQGGPIDLADNLDQYLKLDNLTPEVVVDSTTLSADITSTDSVISVSSTKGFPDRYGILKIDDEIITYTEKTTTSFTGCIRGFSGVTDYHQELSQNELVFEETVASDHTANTTIQNLSSLFLKEFYKKLKTTFAPGFENITLVDELDAGNFIKRAKDFYASKGTDESIKILFKVVFGVTPRVINLEEYLIKPSFAKYIRREVILAEVISGDILKISGQTLFKNDDIGTNAPVSDIESFSIKGKTYYKIEVFIGNDDRSLVEGTFVITPNTRSLERVEIGSDIISVDSTVSFPESGTLVSGNNQITYTSKSVNQFFGCSGITEVINPTDIVRNEEIYFSYENGDTNKKVEVIVLGIIDGLSQKTPGSGVYEGDIGSIKSFGDKINNNANTYKEIFANSWIYNTSTRYQIIDNSSLKLGSQIDRSSLKVGDEVEILDRGSENVISTGTYVESIDEGTNSVTLVNGPSISASTQFYDLRRKLNKSSSSEVSFEYGDKTVLSDILNLYVDGNDYAYVASNSLPSSELVGIATEYRIDIDKNINTVGVTSSSNFLDEDPTTGLYNIINVPSVPFSTGDRVVYSTNDTPITELESNESYYVKKVSSNTFKLYSTLQLLESDINLGISSVTSGTHTFTYYPQRDALIGSQKLLKKIPLQKNIQKGIGTKTSPGSVGMLINGVEINNYKSNDSIYYGPLSDVNVIFGGEDYDVINPPEIDLGVAKVQPVVSGSFEKVYVDTQNYDIDSIVSINIGGGNGSGAVIEPVLSKRSRSVLFDGRSVDNGGGVSTTTNQILFLEDHNFSNGEEVIYNPLGNTSISELPTNSSYFIAVDNSKTVKLHTSLSDQQSGINTVSLPEGSGGTQQFSTAKKKNQISYIQVLEKGSGYTNRNLVVSPSGISTTNNTVNFTNHGFSDGELIEYNYETGSISGLSTTNQYYISKIDDDSFRLSDGGIGGTITSNYNRNNYIKFDSTGSGYQYFKYPDISVSIEYSSVGFGTTTQNVNNLVLTPVVKGSIIDTYLYDAGTGYGSTILNYEKKPTITIKNGKNASASPVIINGSINEVSVGYGGEEYYSVPTLEVIDSSGSGTGAELRAIISNNAISSVQVVNPGIGYSSTSTQIKITSSGKNCILNAKIRKLTVNDSYERFVDGKVLLKGSDKIQYSVSKYFKDLRESFLDVNSNSPSKIIGWAYDGNPIYGPYGTTDPNDLGSPIKTLSSGYTIDTSNIIDRPTGFDNGYFVEDYVFNDSGDLDEHNGRYEKNNDFPNGVYAYHATLDTSVIPQPEFPYFIGDTYNSKLETESLDQSFDFNSSNLLRNTFPYKVSESNADYDFIDEVNDTSTQKIEIDSVSPGSIEKIEILNDGIDYKVGDVLVFDEDGTSGQGLYANVSSVKGKEIDEITTSSVQYLNTIFTWDSERKVRVSILPNHNLDSLDYVAISGFSTNLSKLNGFYQIEVTPSVTGRCLSSITSASVGFTTEIYVSPIAENISIGSSITIGTETLKILDIFRNENILRIERGSSGVSHTVGTAVTFLPDSFTITESVDKFESRVNNTVFFNPRESVGVSTISGVGYSTSFVFGNISSVTRSIPARSIHIENHPFTTNQPIIFTANTTDLVVSTDGSTLNNLSSFSNLFVVNKQPDLIGIKTTITGEELFFHTNGDDNDQYTFETNYTQILGDVEKNEITVSVSTSHGLQVGDTVKLNVEPNLSVGIGTSTAVRVLYKSEIDAIVVNPIGFNSTGVSTTTNEITITDHGLVTGDKVFYEDDTFEYLFDANDQIDTTAQDGTADSVFFKPDGTKMYVVGRSADEVNEYELSTPWSPSTATFTNVIDVTTEDTNPSGIYIRDDGLKFWICGYINDRIYQYSMSTAWDLSTASYDNVSLLVGSGNSLGFTQNSPQGIYFKYDGTVLYIIGSSGDFIHQLDLSTAWDITTASYSGDLTGRLDVNPPDATPTDININSSGTIVYWVGSSADQLYIYELSTPWDITTGVEIDRFAFTNPNGVYVSPDEENFYIVSNGNDIVKRYRRPSPLTESEYYIFKINDNIFNLCETYFDTQQDPPSVVSFASTGGSTQTLSLINPEINPTRNNNLVFDLTDSSLSGYELKIFCENSFENEFVSTGSTNSFTISGVGTVGVTTDASLTLEYNSDLPQDLYYILEQNGEQIGYDNTAINYSRIGYRNSEYTNTYTVNGVATTSFTINSIQRPERLSYSPTETDTLEYTTTSLSVEGSVGQIDILNTGFGYKKLPSLKDVTTENGKDLLISLSSNTIGKEKNIRVVNNRFTYSSDKTLTPRAELPTLALVSGSSTIESIDVINASSGYAAAPDIVLVNPNTREVINSGLFEVVLEGDSISAVNIITEPNGLPNDSTEIFTVNNSNGISVLSVESSNSGIFTCSISTPTLGFTVNPFNIGDKIFVEGIQKFGSGGSGFNSSDYGYKLLNVTNYDNGTIPNKVEISASEFTSNTGIAITNQSYSGTLINESNYPTFDVNQTPSEFIVGEKVSVNGIPSEVRVVESTKNYLRLLGTFDFIIGDIITGNVSSSVATINKLEKNEGTFDINYSNVKRLGWRDGIGRLSEDYQVTPNNDYYQNLSYSIKSPITYKDQQSPVENLVHISGLKNFADVEFIAPGISSITVKESSTSVLYSFIGENRVDSITNFDLVFDTEVSNSKSRLLQLENKRLTNYTEINDTLNVLKIDDISPLFSNFESQNTDYLNIEEIKDLTYFNYLIRITNSDFSNIQLTNITILSNGLQSYIIENESISNVGVDEIHENGEQIGSFDLFEDALEDTYLRFTPVDPFNTDYDLKIIRQVFNESISGVGTQSVGFIDLTANENLESTGIGTTSLIEVNSSEFDSLYVTAQVYNTETKDIDYVKLYLTHDDSNTYMSEYYVDTNFNQLSETNSSQIGTFYSDLNSGILSIYHTNNTGNQIKIRSNIVGFGTTSVGVGTYRYILSGQPEGAERSAIYDSNYYSTVSAASTAIQTFDRNLYNASNSLIQVSVGSTKALHNIMVISDIDDNVYTQQSPFLSVGTTEDEEFDTVSGIGTFGGEISGSDVVVSFYPDPDQTEEIKIEVFSKTLYTEVDPINDYGDLVYGTVIESIDEKFYNSINGDRINRTNFSLFDNNTPIFTKVFNPNSTSLVQNTGVFTIKNHFFSEDEELIYTPNSTFIGVGASAMKYTATDELPSSVFVVNRTVDTFQISTTRSGTAVTFTSLGEGNAHQFTMSERNTKTLITIDDLVQSPIAATKITHTLSGNVGAGITEETTLFSLSGISSINPTDILRIDDEYMGVVNVGLGTTNVGPITNNGTENLVLVDRGFVGSSATSHTDSTLVRIYKGAYNIVDNEIHFAQPPRGNPQIDKTKFNLDFELSDFTGRVFLKSDYTSNKVYDDISDEFTGIGRTFTLKVGGANTTGLGTDGGNGLVFINSIYQSPQTDNNPNLFNYTITEDTVAGVTTLTFSGITRPNTDPLEYVTSEVDVNANQTPRGGIIVSYGSTPGLGFAPLVGASVTATVSAGSITAIGIGTTGTFGSGYNGLTAIGVSVYEDGHSGDVASITATVGAGGTLSFSVGAGGTGYSNPQIFVSDPSYENLPVIGVSRLGIGATTDTGIGLLVDLEVGSATGIGSTLFEVKNFNFSRPGYAFQRGDVFKPVGLVTDGSLSSPLSDFTITVVDTFSDSFAAWEFGELDYIDSIANLKDGVRKVFPLNYNGQLLSFEPEPGSPVENNMSNLLVIFINGILQDPDIDYIFNGGTSFTFTTAPRADDDVNIYFYKGSPIDTALFDDINLSLEVGDTVQVLKNNSYTDTIDQDERLVYDLSFSDKFETNLYSGPGINDDPEKAQPLTWTKKKRGSFINGQYVSKVRDSIEALVFPTARIIKDVTSTDNEIFVENTELFTYEFDNSYNNTHETDSVDALLVNGISTVTTGSVEFIGDINRISGTSGEIIGITTALGIGVDLALQFTLNDDQNFAGLQTGYPVYIHNTRIGSGVTSIDDSDSAIVGIGTTFLDNIYYISGFDIVTGIITCNVKSDSNIIGLSTTGIVTDPVGRFSWGRLFSESGSLTRSNPISIGVSGNIVSGLSTYPTIQRRGGINIRSTGAIGIKTT